MVHAVAVKITDSPSVLCRKVTGGGLYHRSVHRLLPLQYAHLDKLVSGILIMAFLDTRG